MSSLVQLLCLCTSIAYAPVPQTARAYGDIWYTHEVLSRGKHLLRLSTTDQLLDDERARSARLKTFAKDFAVRTCGDGRFVFVDADRPTSYAGQAVFVCR
jgi:hypothetical protein